MHEASGWVAEQVRRLPASAGAEAGRTLVVCRSRATASLVRRWLASEGGRLGLEVALPSAVAAQLLARPLLASSEPLDQTDDPVLPFDTEMGARVAGRPGLTAAARRWVQHVRTARAIGAPVAAPPWVEELLDRGWANDRDHAAMVELLTSGRLQAHGWDRVVAVGAWEEPGVSSPWEDGVLRALCGALPAPPTPVEAPIRAVRVPDVTAEARLAVREAAADPDGTLVLCAHVSTARRVRDALARSGLPCAWRDTEALSAHDVASAVRRASGWFSEGSDPPLQAEDLAFVLGRVALGAPHPAVAASIAARLAAAGLEPVHVTRARLDEVVLHARLLDAPLSVWIDRLEGIAEGVTTVDRDVPRARLQAAAIAVRARLLVLDAALTAVPLVRRIEQDAGAPLAFDPDDFDQIVAQLLGDDAVRGPELPPGSTLGALHRFLVLSRIRIHDDPVAQAILGSLGRRAAWPAGPAWVHQALGGAHDPGVLGEGVDILLADEWDGRPCRTLLLLDVHDHGVGRHSRPDPLLADEEMAAVGALPVRAQVDRRLAQVRRAAARAGRTLAIVSERDASGREVVPPVLLTLRFDSARVGSYGLDLDVPELAPLAALVVDAGPPPPTAPEHPDWEVRHLATQASAEWVREGRSPRVGPPVTPTERKTLADHLRAEIPLAPAWVTPYVGDAAGVPEAALPDTTMSVSGYLNHLAKCGFRAFSTVVLRLKEPEELRAELDAREIGSVVHTALEKASPSLPWRTMDADGRSAALAALRHATDEAFADTSSKLGRLSPSRRAASDGLRDRWNVHWDSYVKSRSLRPATRGAGNDSLYDHPDVVSAAELFAREVPDGADVPNTLVRKWLLEHAGGHDDESSVAFVKDTQLGSDPEDLLTFLRHPEIVDLGGTLAKARIGERLLKDKVVRQVVATELGFGDPALPPTMITTPEGFSVVHLPQMALKLGRSPLPVRGKIDRVEWITTDKGISGIVVTDFKTGSSRFDGWQFRKDVRDGRDPQLLVYAMVLERARMEGALPEALRMPVAVVAHDRVWMTRSTDDGPIDATLEQPDTRIPVEVRWLGAIARPLGELVDHTRDGRWWLRPRADGCPRLSRAFKCPASVACRMRGLPPQDGDEPPTPSEAP